MQSGYICVIHDDTVLFVYLKRNRGLTALPVKQISLYAKLTRVSSLINGLYFQRNDRAKDGS